MLFSLRGTRIVLRVIISSVFVFPNSEKHEVLTEE